MCHIINRTGQKLAQDRLASVSLIFFFHFHQTCLNQRCSEKEIPFSPQLVPAVVFKGDISFTKQLQGASSMQCWDRICYKPPFLTKFGSARKILTSSSYQLIRREKILVRCIYQCQRCSSAIASCTVPPEKNLHL